MFSTLLFTLTHERITTLSVMKNSECLFLVSVKLNIDLTVYGYRLIAQIDRQLMTDILLFS